MRATTLPIVLACLCAAPSAHAHFELMQPVNWVNQVTDGYPQKTGPCGNESPQAASGVVTEYRVGETIPISIRETVYHPGHYRISLAADQASLPPDPVVTPGGSDCGSVPIATNPTLPVLADGLLVHSRPFSGPQTMQVALPAGMTCERCVLQVVEFMSNHGAPCFYYHCANIKITTTGADAGVPGGDGGTDGTGTSGGCAAQRPGASPWLALAVAGFVLRRPRSRHALRRRRDPGR